MPTNDFLVFSGDPAANVMAQSDYAASGYTTRLLGFTRGTASSLQMNKVWRQATLMASVIAKLASDTTGADMRDDASAAGIAALETNLRQMMTTIAQGSIGSGYLPLTGGTLTGPLTATGLNLTAPAGSWSVLNMSAAAGQFRYLMGLTNASPRWQLVMADTAPETGGNAGSNFTIDRYSDAGLYVDTPFAISRANGVASFGKEPTIQGAAMPYLRLTGGALSGPMTVAGNGITYTGVGPGHYVAFGWDNTNLLQAYIDGTSVGALATQTYVAGRVGAYLPLAGGTISGALAVNGPLLGTSAQLNSASFGGDTGFVNSADATNYYRAWTGGWADGWRRSDGLRFWGAPGQTLMTLDGAGKLVATLSLTALGGRIISEGGQPSVTCWNTGQSRADGIWSDGGLYIGSLDGNGNPAAGWAQFSSGLTRLLGSLAVSTGITAGGTIAASQDVVAAGSLYSGNGGGVTVTNTGLVYQRWGTHNIGYSWDGTKLYAQIDGSQIQMVTGSRTPSEDRVNGLGMQGNSAYFLDNDGSGWYLNTFRSDPKLKMDIRLADDFDSLGAISATPIRSFRWRSGDDVPVAHGFISTDLRETMPDAVRAMDCGGALGEVDHVEVLPMLAHAFRAIRQLNERIEAICPTVS